MANEMPTEATGGFVVSLYRLAVKVATLDVVKKGSSYLLRLYEEGRWLTRIGLP